MNYYLKFLGHFVWVVIVALGTAWPQECTQCANIPSSVARSSPPADVDLPEVRLVATDSAAVIAIRHWFDGNESQSRLIESANSIVSRWIEPSILREQDAARNVLYISGSGKRRTVLRRKDADGVVERSVDAGESWQRLKFMIDGKAPSEWVQTFDNTQGTRLIPYLAAVSDASLTLYATFRAWVPQRGNPSEFASWKDIPGMYVSHDGGDNWVLFSNDLVSQSPLGVDGTDSKFLVGVSKVGLVESHDGGRSWTAVGEQAFFNQTAETMGRAAKLAELKAKGVHLPSEEKGPKISVGQIELSRASEETIYLRTNIGLIISRDSGRTWCIAGAGNQVFDQVNGMIVSRDKPNEILISTSPTIKLPSQILRSTDGGCTFKVLYTMRAAALRSAKSSSPVSLSQSK